MRKLLKASLIGIMGMTIYPADAGNPQRVGSAGAAELLVNPWARSGGVGGGNISYVRGIEAAHVNIAGLAFTEKTELNFSNTQWLVGTDMQINSFGFAQKVGRNGVLGLNISAFDYGEWEYTTENQPEGTGGYISPTTLQIGAAYAQKFTENIFGGVNIKLYNQALSNLSLTGLCFDAGVQYHTGDRNQWKFGINLKNVGPSVAFEGDGSDLNLPVPHGGYTQTFTSRSASFELPSQLGMGGSYDFEFGGNENHRLTPSATFISNSFEKDAYIAGAEYQPMKGFQVRAAYTFKDDRVDQRNTSALTGIATGFTVEFPFQRGKSTTIGLDYSYLSTSPFSGVHMFGGRIDL